MEERELVSRVLSGNIQAFRLLIKQHERLVSHMISRVVKNDQECEELCQDVFMRVYERLGDFSFNSKLSTWIATIAYRFAINHARKRKLEIAEIPDEGSFTQHFIDAEHPGKLVEEQDLDAFVLRLADRLPFQYRNILTLYHVEGMTYPEICEVTQMPEGTVKNYLFRARTLLKESMKKYMEKEELL